MHINKENYKTITSLLLSMDEFCYLYSLYLDEFWLDIPTEVKNKLITLGFLSRDGFITTKFLGLLTAMEDTKEIDSGEFQTFWDAYPANDGFGRFAPTRDIKLSGKLDAKVEYIKARVTHSADTILNGLNNYISYLKKTSVTENKLKFMKGPLNFLKQKIYLDYPNIEIKQDFQYGNELA